MTILMSRKNIQNENRIFAPENATPDPSFKKELWDKCEAAYSGRKAETKSKRSFSFINFFSLDLMTKPQRVAIFTFFAVFLLAGVGLITYDFISKTRPNSSTFSQEESTRILNEISKNNPSLASRNNITDSSYRALTANQLSSGNSLMSGVTDEASTQKIASEIMILPWYPEPNTLVTNKIKSTVGPAYATCKYMLIDEYYPDDLSATREMESYSFYKSEDSNSAGTFYSKTLTHDQNGVLRDYYMSDGKFNYYYKGGDFAIKQPIPDYGFGVPLIYEKGLEPESTINNTQTESSFEDNIILENPEVDVPINAGPSVDSGNNVDSIQSTEPNSSVVSENPFPEINPIAPVDPGNPVSPINYLGDSAKVVNKETINGKEYYVVEYETYGYCNEFSSRDLALSKVMSTNPEAYGDDSVVSISMDVPFMMRSWFSVDDYKVLKSETYKTSINPENLVLTEEYEESKENGDLSKFSQIFTFGEAQNIVSVGQIKYTSESVLLEQLLKDRDFVHLTPKTNTANLSSVTIPDNPVDPIIEHFLKRSYYPSTDLGTKMYDRAVNDFSTSSQYFFKPFGGAFISYLYEGKQSTNGLSSWNMVINAFDESYSDEDIWKTVYIDKNNADKRTVSINIDGLTGNNTVLATLYTEEYTSQSSPGYAGDDGSVEIKPLEREIEEVTSYNQNLLFEYTGSKYLVTLYSSQEANNIGNSFVFSGLQVNTDSSRTAFKSLVNKFIDDEGMVGIMQSETR